MKIKSLILNLHMVLTATAILTSCELQVTKDETKRVITETVVDNGIADQEDVDKVLGENEETQQDVKEEEPIVQNDFLVTIQAESFPVNEFWEVCSVAKWENNVCICIQRTTKK